MGCDPLGLCQYETAKLVRIRSARLGSLKWALNALIFLFIGIMLFWNKEYQEHDLVVSSVTTKVKGVALTQVPEVGEMLWDMVDHSGTFQGKNSFFVITNVIVTKKQKQGKCPEGVPNGRLCQSDADCNKGEWDQSSHGVQTGACVKSDVTKKTCEVFTWCPVENKRKPPRPALLMAAENFTVLIKNNIRFPAFSYIKRNILPDMKESYLKSCTFNRRSDPLCPIFRLGDIVQEAKENFTEMAVEGGVMGIQINWDCDLDRLFHKCRPSYSFRRLDEKETNRTLYPGLNFRFAKYYTENGVETRTLYKAYGIRFDVMVFGKAGRFSIIQLIIYIGSTLSYYALTTLFIDWLIGTSCYAKEAQRNYSERKFETLDDHKRSLLCVSFVDEDALRLAKVSRKKRLQEVKPESVRPRKDRAGSLWALATALHAPPKQRADIALQEPPRSEQPAWCQCARCRPSDAPQEQLCCRQSRGRCISTSPAFERLALGRPLLESVLLYRDPLLDLSTEAAPRLLRHCAYDVYIDWRFGAEREGACPVVPSCCVWRIREEYPSPDGRYRGLRPASKVALIPGAHSGC
ncbi:P2X purinoceptor 7 [Scleropages formosus]|uniref:P2X purinoceptor n=1 Tax=Scleropages formosus TaxID=113540 RepID=A0A8C9VFT6_SCLFO|nr:P2X purinoceptor 7 [Scleropages formosus]